MGRRRSRERSPRSTRHRSRSISRSKGDNHSSRSHQHTGNHHHSSHRKKHSKRKAHKSHHHSQHSGDSGRSRRRTVEISIGKDDLKSVLGSQAEFLFTSKADDGTSDSDVSSIDISGVDRGSHERGRTSVEHEFGMEKYDELSTQLKTGSPLCVFEGSSNVKGPMKIVLKGLQDEEKEENTMQKTHFHVNSHSLAYSPQCNQMPDSRWHSDDEHSHSEQRERSLSGSREGSWEQAWEHSKDRTKDRSRDRSRDRARRSRNSSSDLFHGRSKDRSLDRSRRSRDRSGARSRDRSMDRSRDRPRRSRDRSRAQSRDRSMDRPRRSRDRSRARSRDRSRDRLRGLRARSKESHHHSPRRSSSSDREHSYRSRAKQQKNRAEAPSPVLSKKRAEINEYTSICQQISAIDYLSVLSNAQEGATEIAASGVGGEVGSGVAAVVHPYRDPFAVKEAGSIATTNLVFHGSVWKTPTQAVLDGADPSSVGITAEKEFPVSDGIQHHAVEAADGPDDMGSLSGQVTSEVNVSELVMLRMCLAQRLSLNPDDHEAEQQLREVELKVKQWSSSSFKMGQYTGNVTLTSISAKEKQNTGIQAWVRRDMFQNLKPVGDGFGAKMLRKLGWKKGEPLGKSGTGCVEPVADEVKLDRKCLAADDEVAKQKKAKPQTFYPDSNAPDAPSPPSTAQGGPVCTTGCYVGKHPVSALNELCTRKKWTIQYELVMTSGPPHSRSFKYQVTLPVGSFQPDKMCGNKKLAKAEAAMACLKAVGLA